MKSLLMNIDSYTVDESKEAIKQTPQGISTTTRFPLPVLCKSENKKSRFLTKGGMLHHFCSVLLSFFCFSFLFFLTWHCSAVKPSSQSLAKPDRSRPGSVKCVGHFGSVGAGGTQSDCSLEGKCDRASLSFTRRVRLPRPNRVEERAEGGRREADGGGE